MTRFILSLCIVVVCISCKEKSTTPRVEIISVQEMKEVLKEESVQLIDVRTRNEYATNHIKNAKNIVYQGDDWEAQVANLDKAKPVYVYCQKGGRSAKCASLLEKAGFEKVYDLNGGISQWISEGNSVE
ncbi:rhodanese-like domain-containing protein [uncultured Dokdonia sp.]|uniref:rhodanese-like domain-containing protein n=1 Tax=uncultured Dokdonia sp. TaxID=575653 RepID=UPI002613C3DD|nr:rhodanese-like domain-containing protein [uncultured Dokdonia sp.]